MAGTGRNFAIAAAMLLLALGLSGLGVSYGCEPVYDLGAAAIADRFAGRNEPAKHRKIFVYCRIGRKAPSQSGPGGVSSK